MPLFIALYRGINITGRNSVKMKPLCEFHERLGHRNVRNYIQSGNILFQARGTTASIARKLAAEFATTFKFPAKVLVISADQLAALIQSNPYTRFATENPRTVHAAICQSPPDAASLKALLIKAGGNESFTIQNNVLYLHAPAGYGTSKFAAAMEKAAGTPMTVRNWRTIEALASLANETMKGS